MKYKDSIRAARQGLVEHVEGGATTPKHGLIASLFPAIYLASRKLSTRAISEWLQETQNVKISPAGISKALRQAEKYWEWYWDLIEPAARTVESAHDVAMESFLFDRQVYEHMSKEEIHFEDEEADRNYQEARETLEADWFAFENNVLNHMWKFVPKVEMEDNVGKDQ